MAAENETTTLSTNELMAFTSQIVARAQLAARFGMQFGGDRDLYKALGYPSTLVYKDFMANYLRHDISKAVIDRPVKATWQGELELVESQDPDRTPFEQAWIDLSKRLQLRSMFSRVDRLTGIGRYGILLFGYNDVGANDGFQKPVSKSSKLQLLYVKPFGEDSAKIATWETRPNNDRYGKPLLYDVQVADVASGSSSTIKVHYTRIVHITDDNLESEVYGTPRMEAIFNRLMDLEKITGGSAEMFWKGARPGFQGVVDKDFTMTEDTKTDLKDQIEEYENDLRRILVTEGVELKALAQQLSDPGPNMDAQLTCISAVTGIPKRVLSGSEVGQLASTQDTNEWKTYVQARREDHAEPHIIYPTVMYLIDKGILPEPASDDWYVDWMDLFAVSEKDRVEIGKVRASAIREYTTNPLAEAIMPPDAFFDLCLGLSRHQIDLVHSSIEEGISEEQKDLFDDINETMAPPVDVTAPDGTMSTPAADATQQHAPGKEKPSQTRKTTTIRRTK